MPFAEKIYFLEVTDVFVKVFLLLVSADELIVCVVPEVERLWMSGSQALDHRDPTNLDLGGCHKLGGKDFSLDREVKMTVK